MSQLEPALMRLLSPSRFHLRPTSPGHLLGITCVQPNRIAGRLLFPYQHRFSSASHYLPTILQPRFWKSLIPKRRTREGTKLEVKSKEWNPATFFIVIFLLIGSQAIQMIQLRRDFDRFSQETEAKLSLLREVVRKVQNGENVDVAKELGTGDAAKEKEWEEVMRELEEEDGVVQRMQRQRRSKKATPEEHSNNPAGGENGEKSP